MSNRSGGPVSVVAEQEERETLTLWLPWAVWIGEKTENGKGFI